MIKKIGLLSLAVCLLLALLSPSLVQAHFLQAVYRRLGCLRQLPQYCQGHSDLEAGRLQYLPLVSVRLA